MTGRISPARRFSRTSARSRASWRRLSARSPRTPFERYSRGEQTAVSMRSARSRRSGCRAWSGTALDLQRALNARLPADLGATDAGSVPSRSILGSTRYGANIAIGSHSAVVSPFLGRYAWNRRSGLDADAMRAGAGRLVGTHDFASFAGGGEGVPWSQRATRPKGTDADDSPLRLPRDPDEDWPG